MPVADTSFIIDMMRGDRTAIGLFEEYEQQGIALCTTAITAMELYKGAYVSKNQRNVEKAERILDLFAPLPLDETIYQAYGRVAAGLCLYGKSPRGFQ